MTLRQSIDHARPANFSEVLARTEAALVALRAQHADGTLPLLRLPQTRDDIAAILGYATLLRDGATDVVFLGTGAASYMNIAELADLGVTVHTIKGYGDTAVAEHTIALMWAACRDLARMDRDVRAGVWETREGVQLLGKTLGVIGLGGIGREVARIAQGMGMKVIGWNRSKLADAPVPMVGIDELLAQSDVVSVNLVLNDETAPPPVFPDLTAKPVTLSNGGAKFDLSLYLTEDAEGLHGHAVFATDLFERTTVVRMMRSFERLLASAVATPGRPFSRGRTRSRGVGRPARRRGRSFVAVRRRRYPAGRGPSRYRRARRSPRAVEARRGIP